MSTIVEISIVTMANGELRQASAEVEVPDFTSTRRLTDRDHPADDPVQIEAMRLAIGVRDMPVARMIAVEVLARRERWERDQIHASSDP